MTPEQLAALGPQLALLGPLVTPDLIERARRRLTHQKERIEAEAKDADQVARARVALILVRVMNPAAHFTNEEEGILRGMNADTYGRMRATGEI